MTQVVRFFAKMDHKITYLLFWHTFNSRMNKQRQPQSNTSKALGPCSPFIPYAMIYRRSEPWERKRPIRAHYIAHEMTLQASTSIGFFSTKTDVHHLVLTSWTKL